MQRLFAAALALLGLTALAAGQAWLFSPAAQTQPAGGFVSQVDPNWWKRFQFAGVNPTVVMDFADGLYWNGSQTLTSPSSFISGSGAVTSGSGLGGFSTNTTATGALLTAFQNTSGYNVQIATFGAPAAGGTNIGFIQDNAVNGVLMNITNGAFMTFNNSNSTLLEDTNAYDWTKTNWGSVSVAGALSTRRLSSVGTGAGTAGAAGTHAADANGYGSPTSITLGSWNGANVFGGFIASMAVFNNTVLADRVIPPAAFTGTNGWWWNGDLTNSGISYGNILQYERTQPWTVVVAQILFALGGGGHNGVSGIYFTNVTAASPFPGYEFWVDGNGNATVRVINTNGTNLIDVHGGTVLADGKWHVVAATYDGSSRAAGVQIYVDGNPETMTVVSDTLTASIVASGQDYIIGNQQAVNFALMGAIGLFRQFNVVKSQAFIQNFKINYTVPPCDSTCVLAPKLNEGGSSTTTGDYSSNNFTGTMANGNQWLRG
jgi:hypothetical protein